MAGLKELAQSLGLSITTVSRALDGYPDVSKATRARVVAAADAAGYRPNAAARRLRRQKSDLIVLPLPNAGDRIGTPHLTEIVAGCAARLNEEGLNLMIAPVAGADSELDLCRRLVGGRRVDGMVLVRTRCNDPRVEYLLDRGVPFVTDGRTESARPHAWLDGDGFGGFRAATRRLIGAGHRRIGLIAGEQGLFFARDRADGFRAAMAEAGLAADLIALTELSEDGGYQAATALMQGAAPATALVCTTDTMALGALAALRALRVRAAVVGHDNLPIGAWSTPSLSTMRMDAPDIGRRLGTLLLRVMAGEPVEDLHELLPVIAVDRESHLTGPVSARSAS